MATKRDLVDDEWLYRENRKLVSRLKVAKFKERLETEAGVVDITEATHLPGQGHSEFFIEFDGMRPHQVHLEGGDASSDSYCFS